MTKTGYQIQNEYHKKTGGFLDLTEPSREYSLEEQQRIFQEIHQLDSFQKIAKELLNNDSFWKK